MCLTLYARALEEAAASSNPEPADRRPDEAADPGAQLEVDHLEATERDADHVPALA